MITRREIERLAALHSDDGIVSAYIGIEPELRYDPQHHRAQFQSALKRYLQRDTSAEHHAIVEREKARITEFLSGPAPGGRGLAIFASTPAGIWETVSFEMLVPSYVQVDSVPSTRILTQVLDEYPRFVVVTVQRDHAVIYEAEQRRAAADARIESEVPGHHDQGGWAQARFQRHTEVHVQRHLHQVVEELEQLFHNRPFRRLAIGGTEETTKELIEMLPDPVRRTLIGTFHVDVKHTSEEDVLNQARALHREHERQTEQELVTRLADAAESGGRGAIGIGPTLEAVRDGRVDTLVLADGITVDGSACLNCDYFAAEHFDRCPACGSEAEPAPDIIDRALERAFLSGARIESAFGEASEWLIARGGLGAVLRY